MAFLEIAEKAWKIPERFVEHRYTSVMHGVGMHGESPFIAHALDYDTYGRGRAAAKASSPRTRS